jgi:hypothetical protein
VADLKPEPQKGDGSDWEQTALARLQAAGLPTWEYKAQAATYVQGHRGILDLDLDFPSAYLKEPTEHCYVWKIEIDDGTRVHAYTTLSGKQFHLHWLEGPGDKSQTQPEHLAGHCAEDGCQACRAAAELATLT